MIPLPIMPNIYVNSTRVTESLKGTGWGPSQGSCYCSAGHNCIVTLTGQWSKEWIEHQHNTKPCKESDINIKHSNESTPRIRSGKAGHCHSVAWWKLSAGCRPKWRWCWATPQSFPLEQQLQCFPTFAPATTPGRQNVRRLRVCKSPKTAFPVACSMHA